MLPYSKVKTFQEELNSETAKHTNEGIYRAPKINADKKPFGNNSLFVSYGIKDADNINTCCKKNIVYFDCNICDIHIRFVVPKYVVYMRWDAAEFHQHKFEERIFLVNGEEWGRPDTFRDLTERFSIEEMTEYGKGIKPFAKLKCLLCGNDHDKSSTKRMNNIIQYHARDYLEHRTDTRRRYSNERNLMISIHRTIREYVNNHLQKCPKIHEIRKSLFGEDNRTEHNRLADGIRHEIYSSAAKYKPREEMNLSENMYDHAMIVKKCDCGDSFSVECKICGGMQDVYGNYSFGSVRLAYENIIRSHIAGRTGNLKYNYTDLLVPMNRHQVYIGRSTEYYSYQTGGWKKKRVEIPNWVCDGYKCAICGVEYDSSAGEVPDKTVILEHSAECMRENKQEIINSGRLCI